MRTVLIRAATALSAVVLAGVLTGGTAVAARYQKATTVQVQAAQTNKTKVQSKPKGEGPSRPSIMAEQFRTGGAIGSHLENLERNDGFKGFNQAGVNEIIRATDPRQNIGA